MLAPVFQAKKCGGTGVRKEKNNYIINGLCIFLGNFSSLYWVRPKHDLAKLGIFWDHHFPKLRYATIEVESDQGKAAAQWESYSHVFGNVFTPAIEYQKLSLDAVCRNYTSEELAKG